jgi:hypothetical protein
MLNVHVVPPLPTVQPELPGVVLKIDGVPASTTMLTDWVEGDTARRERLPEATFAFGTFNESRTEVRPLDVPAGTPGIAEWPEPLHAASARAAAKANDEKARAARSIASSVVNF